MPVYNFSYVDQIYDGLLKDKVRPFIELSFMPKKLTADPKAIHPFWYKQNVDFWAGNPKESTYYELYDRTARAIKRVSPRLRVGGPSTAQAAWVDRFIRHAAEKNVPVDFV